MGGFIDLISCFKNKKFIASDKSNQTNRKLKYAVLAVVFGFAVFGIQISWLFDPIVIFGRFISLNFIPGITFLLDQGFIVLIKASNMSQPLLDLYRMLHENILGVKINLFSHSAITLFYFTCIVITALWVSRLWCRTICPLGALYALVSKLAPFKRIVTKCVSCSACRNICRMGAINQDFSYVKSECILCMDCVYCCPTNQTFFTFKDSDTLKNQIQNKKGITRREFLTLGISSALACLGFKQAVKDNDDYIRHPSIIRPPAALKESTFLNRCIRCGNCMKVCPTNALQPVLIEAGARAIWSPRLAADIGYCEYNCTLCSEVCPTGAIKKLPLEKKQKIKLGLAVINKKLCLPWKEKKECIVCEEHCPVPDKAIKIKEEVVDGVLMLRPEIDEKLCTGCGICQTKCPVGPIRAVQIIPKDSDRF
jgi:MauM/NapG family ferredoxin protein